VATTAESLHMTIDEIESGFTYGQLSIMSIIQEISHADLRDKGSGKSRVLNRGHTPAEQNAAAWKHL